MTEIWKDIPGYEGIYQASNLGRLKVLRRLRKCVSKKGTHFTASLPEKILQTYKGSNSNHRWVLLVNGNGVEKRFGVHVLILMTFLGPPPKEGMMCCHKDDIADNNIPSNLYWGDRKTNGRDAVRNGRSIKAGIHPQTKLSESQVVEIKRD